MEYAVTDKKLVFFYFKSLQGTENRSVIDIGMFLKRMGSLSRSALDLTIPAETALLGVDSPYAPSFPVYEKLYDRVIPSFKALRERFSIGIILAPDMLYSKEEQKDLFLWCAGWCDKTLTDADLKEKSILDAFGKREEIFHEGQRYLALYRREGR